MSMFQEVADMLLLVTGIWLPREEFKQHAEKKLRAAEDKTEKAGLPVLDHFHTCKYHEVVCPSHGNFGP